MKRRRWLSAVVCALVLSTAWTKSAHKRRHGKQARRLLEQLAAVQVGGSAGSVEDGALYPPVYDAATGAVITASATCGEDGPEKYCRELASTRARGLGAGACGTCDSHSVAQRHPASHAIDDDTTTWWQSPSLAQGEEYESVDLVLDLGDVFELVYVVAASGPSARAAAFSLSARENEEHEWLALRHFSRDQRLCASLFQNATCETYFTARKPLENGEIHISLEGEAAIRARWVLVSLRALHDAHALDRRYYSVRALSVGARCACNGHADACTFKDGKSVCACREGLCGAHCERCCEGWRAAPWTSGRPCEACPCGARARDCKADPEHGVICVDCLENTAGPHCEYCDEGFYRKEVSADAQFGICLPCDCHPIGSEGACTSGEDREPACACRDGFAGARCERCLATARGEQEPFPSCVPAQSSACVREACDERGVIEQDSECEEPCMCKVHVRGELCDSCAPGHFALSARHDEGCLPCYCSGEADECQVYSPKPIQIQTQEGWTVSDIGVTYTDVPMNDSERGWLSFGYFDLPNFEHYFWNAPAAYLGNKLEAYGGRLAFSVYWEVMRGDTSGKPIEAPQMVIIGTNGLKIAFGESAFQVSGDWMEISTAFLETGWYHVPASLKDIVTRRRRTFLEFRGEPVTRFQFMSVLSDIKYILLRAKFHTDQVEVRLLNAILHIGGDNGTAYEAAVERCSCPVGYAGLSCERCAFGFARVAAQDGAGWACVACDCHGHAESCDVQSGQCSSCLHNTDGERCERCAPGYFGDARSGGCRQCACPLLDPGNNFSPACVTDPDVPERYICTECPKGYAGDHCEVCDYGYWGMPGVPGGTCVPCGSCGDAPCDMLTGDCLECPDNTDGYKCQGCKELYWRGSGGSRACSPCACSVTGSAGATCELQSGACACRPRYTGRSCDICEEGFGNVTAECPACTCNIEGALGACDALTGECTCKSGVGGAECDTCLDLHFGFGDDGCSGCNCSVLGAEGASCDIRTGQCRCRQHVTGLSCDKCETGYWNLSRTGCSSCSCDARGSLGTCDARTGACKCKPGVGGLGCNTCLTGYYGFGSNGCLRCPGCATGQVCDVRTGRCACPPLSVGTACRECRAASWGNEPGVGCKPCSCSPLGSDGPSCDVRTGACVCRAGWAGARCDVCARGHFGARCRPCACEAAGTRNSTCDADTGVCDCNQSTGQCDCKENVEGLKCTTCRDGSFGLAARNPLGCTRCFCFGRSSRCTQAGLTWGQVRAQTRHLHVQVATKPASPLPRDRFRPPINFVSINKEGELPLDVYAEDGNIELTATNGITVIPETDGNITIGINQDLPYPLYWELPEKFRHDQVTSYGGFLRFECHSTGIYDEIPDKILGHYPLVQIHSHGVLVLEYYEFYPNSDGIYEVRFHESLWSLRSPTSKGVSVERSTLMVALQHIDHIYVRATKHSAPIQATLVSAAMDTAILVSGQPSGAPVASGVEMCSCPEAYGASSCQEAAIGFWIPQGPRPDADVAADASGTIIIQLISEAEPCYCNGRSNVCDKHTGYCLNCTMSTSGAQCELCAPGYYGSPHSGCRACPCPSTANNRAAACLVLPDTLTCDCRPGYAGEDCSVCAVGWYRARDGSCAECGCVAGGALGAACGVGAAEGQCECRDHTTGRHCDRCKAPRHFLQGDLCVPCDNCTQTLMDTVETMAYTLMKEADPSIISAIPKPYPRLQMFANQTEALREQVYIAIQSIDSIRSLPRDPYTDLVSQVENIAQSAKNTNIGMNIREKMSSDLKKEADHLLKRIFLIENEIEERIDSLEEFAQSERHISVHRALKEGRNLLRKIKNIDLVDYIASAYNIDDKAQWQAKNIQNYEKQLNDHKQRVTSLQENFSIFNKKIVDISMHNDKAWNNMEQVIASTKRFNNHIQHINDKIENVRIIQDNVIEMKKINSTLESAVIVEQCVTKFEKLPTMTVELLNLTNLAEEKEGILYRINPDYKDKYLEKAKAHAENLTTLANKYKSLFSETRSGAGSAVSASTAYADIAAAVERARAAATQALRSAAQVTREPGELLLRSQDTKGTSEGHLQKAKERLEMVKEMSSELERSRQNVDRIRLTIRSIGWTDKDLTVRTGNLGNVNVSGHLAIANNKSDRVYENMRALYKEADAIHKDTLYKLRRKLQDLQSHGDDKIGGAEEKVSLARGNIEKGSEIAVSLLAAAQMRGQEAARANRTLAAALRLLRDKIARAKHAAQGIQVSLRSKPNSSTGCVRSYRLPHLAPSSTSRIILALSLGPQDMRDSVLFHLKGASSGDFLTIEVVSRRVKFSWNLGGDTAFAMYPDMLDPVSDSDYTWYRIQAERIWNTGQLDVRRVTNSGLGSKRSSPATNSSSPQWGVLHVGGGDVAWVGGVGGAGLSGCLYKLSVDGHSVGLWNFHSEIPNSQCVGCTEGTEEPSSSEEINMYYFNGQGYSVLRRAQSRPHNRHQLSVALTFRTHDEDALLFMAIDSSNNRSVSLSLRACRVVFRVEYADGAALEMSAAGRHCSGRLVRVQAARVFVKRKLEKGSLRVNGEETLGSPNPPIVSSAALPDLSSSVYWVGGAPPAARIWSPLPPPLLGCLGDITVDQEGYNPMDTTQHFGVEPKCLDRPLSMSGFRGDGYLELPSHSLRRKTQWGLMFRSAQPDALLMFSVPRQYRPDLDLHLDLANQLSPDYTSFTQTELPLDDKNNNYGDGFYSIALSKGDIVAILNAGKGNLKLTSNNSRLNDGRFHSVRLIKSGRKIELSVDDKTVSLGSLLGGSVLPVDEQAGLFVGGLPEHLNRSEVTDQRIAANAPLQGAVKDIIFDGSLVSLGGLVSMRGALVGRAGPGSQVEEAPDAHEEPRAEEPQAPPSPQTPQGCQKVASYTLEPGAVKFGDVAQSYAQVHVSGRSIWQRDLLLAFHFRTFYPNGLLFIAPGSKEKHRHLLAVYLRDGRLTLLLKGRRKKEIFLPQIVNDGQWRHVVLRCTGKRLSLVLGARAVATRLPKKLLLSNVMYVGGLPERASMPNVPEHIWKLEGLKGCMRKLTVNGRPEDLVRDAALHHNVGQCFPAVEKGAHFAGDAHAVWSHAFALGAHLELRMEFRTAEPNGVLLATARTPHMSLEIHDGNLIMTVKWSRGRRLRVSAAPSAAFGLCDNAWHSVSALYSADGLSLRLDRQAEQIETLAGGTSATTSGAEGDDVLSINEHPPQSPLYIGGIPDGASSGTLLSRENFKGCIRNVAIRGHRKDWTDMDAIHNVLLSSCPVVQS